MKIKGIMSLIFFWLPFAFLGTVLCGLVYVSVQQDLRQGANDPQIQIAEDTADALSAGQSPMDFTNTNAVDIGKSLSPYVIIFDDAGQPLTSTVTLHNQTPIVPSGVFNYVKQYGEDRFTWQPEDGIRSAVVVVHYTGKQSGFVLAGRSLREVEKREEHLEKEVFFAWIASLIGTLILVTGIKLIKIKQ